MQKIIKDAIQVTNKNMKKMFDIITHQRNAN